MIFFDDLTEGGFVVVVTPLFDGEGFFAGAVCVVPDDEFLARGFAVFVKFAHIGGLAGIFDAVAGDLLGGIFVLLEVGAEVAVDPGEGDL